MQAIVTLIHIIFPVGTLLMALPLALEVVPQWLGSSDRWHFGLGIGIPVWIGIAASPGYAYYVTHRRSWRTALPHVRRWVRASLVGGAIAAGLGSLWTVVLLPLLSILPIVTTILCVLALRSHVGDPTERIA